MSDRGAYRRRLEQDLERARTELLGAAKTVALLEEHKSASHLAEVKTRVFKNQQARMPATSLQQTRKHASPPPPLTSRMTRARGSFQAILEGHLQKKRGGAGEERET